MYTVDFMLITREYDVLLNITLVFNSQQMSKP